MLKSDTLPKSTPQKPSPTHKGQKFPIEVLDQKEILALLKQCSPRCPTGLRNRALLVVLWRGLLRISEALSLKPADVSADSIRVLRGKGGKARVVGIDPEGAAVIERWMVYRKEKLGFGGTKPLFCTLDGRAVQASYVRVLFKRLGRKAGICKRVHPHGLRHAGASELLREGVNLGIISGQLGHSSLATTNRYANHLAPTEVVAAMSQRKWQAEGKVV